MSPPQFGHAIGNSAPIRAISLAYAIREVSRERGFSRVLQQPPVACPPIACPPVGAWPRVADVPDCERCDSVSQPVIRREHAWLALRRQGHPWPLPPWAVEAKAEVWLDRHASLLLADAGASAAAASSRRGDSPRPEDCPHSGKLARAERGQSPPGTVPNEDLRERRDGVGSVGEKTA